MNSCCYKIGEKEFYSKTITEKDVYNFAEISGDFNPIHIDKEEAEKSVFGKLIAHGFLVASFISNIIGMKLPGKGSIYLEQDLKFKKPVYIGDIVTASVEIVEIINAEKRILKLKTIVKNQEDVIVIEGYAVVKAPDRSHNLIN